MNTMRTIGFGIIGCGLMGRELASAMARWLHLLDIDVRPELVAVCDPNELQPGHAGRVGKQFLEVKPSTVVRG